AELRIDWLPELLGFASTPEVLSDGEAEVSSTDGPSKPSGMTRGHPYPKRAFDLFVAGLLFVIMAPLFGAITVLIAIDLGLPVVFWQNRPGRYGRPFKMYKFRTMRAPHDEQGNRIPDQHRVSRVGALLRLARLDELPQLY